MVISKLLMHSLAGSIFVSVLGAGLSITTALSPERFSMVGNWSGSPDCPITFYKDDGGSVEGNCDNGSYNHIFRGNYYNPSQITLTLTRIDPNHCVTSVPCYIRIVNNDYVEYWQGGWDGCGVRTQPTTQVWYRLPRTPDAPLEEFPPPTEPSSGTYPPPTTPTTEPNQQPCLIKIGEFCIFPPPQ